MFGRGIVEAACHKKAPSMESVTVLELSRTTRKAITSMVIVTVTKTPRLTPKAVTSDPDECERNARRHNRNWNHNGAPNQH